MAVEVPHARKAGEKGGVGGCEGAEVCSDTLVGAKGGAAYYAVGGLDGGALGEGGEHYGGEGGLGWGGEVEQVSL